MFGDLWSCQETRIKHQLWQFFFGSKTFPTTVLSITIKMMTELSRFKTDIRTLSSFCCSLLPTCVWERVSVRTLEMLNVLIFLSTPPQSLLVTPRWAVRWRSWRKTAHQPTGQKKNPVILPKMQRRKKSFEFPAHFPWINDEPSLNQPLSFLCVLF